MRLSLLVLLLALPAPGCSLLFEPGLEDSPAIESEPDAGPLAEPDAEVEVEATASCPPVMPLRPDLREVEIGRDLEDTGLITGFGMVGDSGEDFLLVGLPEGAPTYQENFEGIFLQGGESGAFIAISGELVIDRLCDVGMAGTLRGATFTQFDFDTETIVDGPACEREVSIEFEMGLICPE
jgi:hypothetical protein